MPGPLVSALPLLFLQPARGAEPELLLVGNSYILANSLDQIIGPMLVAGLGEGAATSVAFPGLRWADHLREAGEAGSEQELALVSGTTVWNWVVLQEQSQIPGFPPSDSDYQESIESLGGLDALIAAKGGQTVLMMTWGRRDGDGENPKLYPDYLTMQAALAEGYLRYVEQKSSAERRLWVAPVGLAFQHIYLSLEGEGLDPLDPSGLFAALYVEDGSHPSPLGSHLAAAVIYTSITGLSPLGLPDAHGLDSGQKAAVEEAARAVVLEETPEIAYPFEEGGDAGGSTGADGADGASPSDSGGAPADEGNAVKAEEGCGCQGGEARAGFWAGLALLWGRRKGRTGNPGR
jgi:hypothetical protein